MHSVYKFLVSGNLGWRIKRRTSESTELEITLNPKVRQYDLKNKLYPKGRSTMGMPGTKVTKKRDKKWKHGR